VLITLLCAGLPCMSCRHGDLKAGNVLLQASTGVGRAGSGAQQQELLRVWTQAGCLPLTAKVADFGLALPLGPTDTHATLLARVRVGGGCKSLPACNLHRALAHGA
jgi:serine/threonine protein kinase